MPTLRQFVPGTNPCSGDCPIEWAAQALSFPARDSYPITLFEGTICEKMTYAKDSTPYVSSQGYYLAAPEFGIGFHHEGKIIIQLDVCGNWAVCKPKFALYEFSPPIIDVSAAETSTSVNLSVGTFAPVDELSSTILLPSDPPIPPVSLSPSGLFLPAALLTLYIARKLQGDTR